LNGRATPHFLTGIPDPVNYRFSLARCQSHPNGLDCTLGHRPTPPATNRGRTGVAGRKWMNCAPGHRPTPPATALWPLLSIGARCPRKIFFLLFLSLPSARIDTRLTTAPLVSISVAALRAAPSSSRGSEPLSPLPGPKRLRSHLAVRPRNSYVPRVGSSKRRAHVPENGPRGLLARHLGSRSESLSCRFSG
jgi:hypothetical protein